MDAQQAELGRAGRASSQTLRRRAREVIAVSSQERCAPAPAARWDPSIPAQGPGAGSGPVPGNSGQVAADSPRGGTPVRGNATCEPYPNSAAPHGAAHVSAFFHGDLD